MGQFIWNVQERKFRCYKIQKVSRPFQLGSLPNSKLNRKDIAYMESDGSVDSEAVHGPPVLRLLNSRTYHGAESLEPVLRLFISEARKQAASKNASREILCLQG